VRPNGHVITVCLGMYFILISITVNEFYALAIHSLLVETSITFHLKKENSIILMEKSIIYLFSSTEVNSNCFHDASSNMIHICFSTAHSASSTCIKMVTSPLYVLYSLLFQLLSINIGALAIHSLLVETSITFHLKKKTQTF
jgi:hypothetical protein